MHKNIVIVLNPITSVLLIPAVPGEPQVQSAEYEMGKCAINISWIPPSNITISDTTHFMIYIDGENVHNVTNSNSDTILSLSHQVSSCDSHNVSVSAVDRCGRESPPSSATVNPGKFCVCLGVSAGRDNSKCTIS